MTRFAALLLLISSSASAQYLVPLDYEMARHNNQSYIELDSVTYTLENLAVESDYLVFSLEVINQSSQPVLVQSSKMITFMSYTPISDSAMTQHVLARSAMTPSQIERLFKNKVQQAEALSVLLAVAGVALVVNDAVKDTKDYSDESWTPSKATRSAARDVATVTGLVATDILSEVAYRQKRTAREELHYLPNELFVKEWIEPGERYFGKVLFRKEATFEYYRIILPSPDGLQFNFDFRKATGTERKFIRSVHRGE